MFEYLQRKGKKVFIGVDEISNSSNTRTFVQAFQCFSRLNYPVYLVMTGLYENVLSLQNQKALTFLYRAPKLFLSPLNLQAIADSYQTIFKISIEEAKKLALLTLSSIRISSF